MTSATSNLLISASDCRLSCRAINAGLFTGSAMLHGQLLNTRDETERKLVHLTQDSSISGASSA